MLPQLSCEKHEEAERLAHIAYSIQHLHHKWAVATDTDGNMTCTYNKTHLDVLQEKLAAYPPARAAVMHMQASSLVSTNQPYLLPKTLADRLSMASYRDAEGQQSAESKRINIFVRCNIFVPEDAPVQNQCEVYHRVSLYWRPQMLESNSPRRRFH